MWYLLGLAVAAVVIAYVAYRAAPVIAPVVRRVVRWLRSLLPGAPPPTAPTPVTPTPTPPGAPGPAQCPERPPHLRDNIGGGDQCRLSAGHAGLHENDKGAQWD